MLKSFLLISGLILMSFSVHATLNQSNWKPGKDGCGFGKFKCPAYKLNKCIKRPKKRKCQVIKLKSRKSKVIYQNYCKSMGYKCKGSYSSCQDGQYSVSVGSTKNPYAACAP